MIPGHVLCKIISVDTARYHIQLRMNKHLDSYYTKHYHVTSCCFSHNLINILCLVQCMVVRVKQWPLGVPGAELGHLWIIWSNWGFSYPRPCSLMFLAPSSSRCLRGLPWQSCYDGHHFKPLTTVFFAGREHPSPLEVVLKYSNLNWSVRCEVLNSLTLWYSKK